MSYKKTCVVPQCTSTSIKNSQKLFISVPKKPNRRNQWLQLAKRDPNTIMTHSSIFMCEDHFEMEKDIVNYTKFKMGFSQRLLLTENAIPTKFDCQDVHKRQLCKESTPCEESTPCSSIKRQKSNPDIIDENIKELPKTQNKETNMDPIISFNKSTQVEFKKNIKNIHFRSKCVQVAPIQSSISTSPFKVTTFKILKDFTSIL